MLECPKRIQTRSDPEDTVYIMKELPGFTNFYQQKPKCVAMTLKVTWKKEHSSHYALNALAPAWGVVLGVCLVGLL